MRKQLNGTPLATFAAYTRAVLACTMPTGADGLSRVPTQIVHGTRDRLVSIQGARALAASVPGANLTVLPNIGHMVQIEASKQINRLLDDVLAGALTTGTHRSDVAPTDAFDRQRLCRISLSLY